MAAAREYGYSSSPHTIEYLLTSTIAVDSVEDTGDTWVRSAGFEEAWIKLVRLSLRVILLLFINALCRYEDRPRAQL